MTVESPMKVIICGAGLIGLLTAQMLKNHGIEFEIFDRDENPTSRENQGWAITLHWALETFKSLIPEELAVKIYEAQVRPKFHLADTGTFKYINGSTGETIFSIPPSLRLRVRREQVRRILLNGINVNWGCKLVSLDSTQDGVTAICEGGRQFSGNILLGCDGANSMVRRNLCHKEGELNKLPFRFCGAKVEMTNREIQSISENFDPLLFQGTIPHNNTFFWYSILAMPDYTKKEDTNYAQVNLSWRREDSEPFDTPEDRARAMKIHATGLHEDLMWMVDRAVKNPSELQEIKLCDWPDVAWNSLENRVILLGDAAHAMTMYRGEAANHGITDVYELSKELDLHLNLGKDLNSSLLDFMNSMKTRASPAVLLSRQACYDAHDFSKINVNSPLVAIRKKT